MGKGAAVLDKDTYRIGEVALQTKVEPHVLRYWESEFPALHPVKTPSGQRLYRREDIETVLTIKRLLYDEGFTIAGARKQLESGNGQPTTPAAALSAPAPPHGDSTRDQLLAVRAQLRALLTLLSGR